MIGNADFAAKYAALEVSLGFKPALLRDTIAKHGEVEAAFSSLSGDPFHRDSLAFHFEKAIKIFSEFDSQFSILAKGKGEYPQQLKSWANPTEVLYIRGDVSILSMNAVAVVGSRLASDDGRLRATRLAKILGDNRYCVTSGLALGIDTAAHTGALRARAKTMAVIGTPIHQYYPRENKELQDLIGRQGVIVSQFSPLRKTQPLNFPLRNELMSAFSQATIIVEAGETSGALTQAKHALKQGKKLFIMQNQIDKTELVWTKEFLKKGAVALKSVEDLFNNLQKPISPVAVQTQLKLL